MLKFKSVIFEEIIVEGTINLKAERKFKLFRNFELNRYNGSNSATHFGSNSATFYAPIKNV